MVVAEPATPAGGRPVDPNRVARNQAELLTSAPVLEGAARLADSVVQAYDAAAGATGIGGRAAERLAVDKPPRGSGSRPSPPAGPGSVPTIRHGGPSWPRWTPPSGSS